jgi:hypothetical protein
MPVVGGPSYATAVKAYICLVQTPIPNMHVLTLGLVLLTVAGSPRVAPTLSQPITSIPASSLVPVAVRDVQASRPFSNLQQPDKFRLQLVGENILTAKVHFTIVTAGGSTVWSEWFPATQLLGTYGQEPVTDADKEAVILKRFATFFEQKNFLATAIKPNATFDAEYNGRRAVWQEIKQRKVPGFTYRLGLEDNMVLSYAPTQGKAVVVHRCC